MNLRDVIKQLEQLTQDGYIFRGQLFLDFPDLLEQAEPIS